MNISKITISLSSEAPSKSKEEGSCWGTYTFVPYKVSLLGLKNEEIVFKVVYGALGHDGVSIYLADELRFSFKKKKTITACVVSPIGFPEKRWYLSFNYRLLPMVVDKKNDIVIKNLRISLS